MGLWQILKGEQPGLLKSVLHYRNAGQFGEYLIDYALQSNGIEGERVVLTNLYLPMKGKTTEIDLLMLHEKGIFVIESKYYSGWIFGSEDQLKWTQCFRNGRKEHFYIFLAVLALGGVHDVIGLDEDLVIDAVNVSQGMVMADQIRNAVNLCRGQTSIMQKFPHQGPAFKLLMFAVCIAVFLSAERAGNVMRDSGNFQYVLRLSINMFEFADGLGECPDTNKMVDVVDVTVRIANHLL